VIGWLSPYRWLAAGLIAACIAAAFAVQAHRLTTVRAELAAEQLARATEKASAAAAMATASENYRVEEQRRIAALKEIEDATSHRLQAAAAERDAASAAARGLSERVAALVAASRAQAPRSPAPVANGKAAPEATQLLANVLLELDRRSAILADYADRARVAGQACVDEFDALTPPL
jgi:hypothetical protein